MPVAAFENAFQNFSNQSKDLWESFLLHLPELVLALTLFAISFFVSRVVYRITSKLLKNRVSQLSVARLISKTASAAVIFLGLFMALNAMNLGKSLNGLLAGAGISGLIIGLALQGTLSNTISGIVLSLRKNIRVGDWIETNDFKGEVIQITLNYLVLKESDNNIVVIPNKTILESPMKNYSQTSKMRVVLECGISYDTDLEKVREITTNLISKRFGSERIKETPEFYFTEFGNSSINFMCRFWIYGESGLAKLKARSELIIELKKAFDEHNIQIPFPIRTLEFKNQEILEPSISL
ncbi:MAG: mechanosensitive ion channel family protein [Lutimonas sp.]